MKIKETERGVLLQVLVKPKSREFRIYSDGDLVIACCTEEPVKGRVNKELMKETSKRFNKRVELVSGSTSREKTLLIVGAKRSEMEQLFQQERS